MCNARFKLANPTPRLCPDAVGSANVNGFPTRHRLSEPHREGVGRSGAERVQCSCLPGGVVINRTPSPYQLTRMYALRAIQPRRMGSRCNVGWFCPDLPPTTSEANRGIGSANVKRASVDTIYTMFEDRFLKNMFDLVLLY